MVVLVLVLVLVFCVWNELPSPIHVPTPDKDVYNNEEVDDEDDDTNVDLSITASGICVMETTSNVAMS